MTLGGKMYIKMFLTYLFNGIKKIHCQYFKINYFVKPLILKLMKQFTPNGGWFIKIEIWYA